MVNRGELCAALLLHFNLALDGITVITALSRFNQLSTIQINYTNQLSTIQSIPLL